MVAALPVRPEGRGGGVAAGYVWHCPVRLHPDDPVLADEQWQHVANRLMTATGLHQAGCRWIAVRHADDHIHLVATLSTSAPANVCTPAATTCSCGKRAGSWTRTRIGHYRCADRTAAPAPTPPERGKAARLGRPRTTRQELRRLVGHCAAISHDGSQIIAELAREDLEPRTVRDEAGRIRGYSVSWTGDRTTSGQRVRYSGSALAPDLIWPKLEARWATTPAPRPLQRNQHGRPIPAERRAALAQAVQLADRTTGLVRDGDDEDVNGIVHAAGDVLAVLSRGSDGYSPGPLTDLAIRHDRGARTPHCVLPVDLGYVARDLRQAARRLGALGVLTGRAARRSWPPS